MKLAKRIGKDTGLYSLDPVIRKILGIALVPLYTAYLTTSDYGMMSYIIAIGSFTLPFITMGMNSVFWMYYKGSNEEKGSAIFVSSTISSLISIPIVLLALLYYLFKRDMQSYLVFIYISALGLRVLYERGLTLLRAQNRIGWFLTSSALLNIVRIGAAIVFVVLLRLSVSGVIFSQVVLYVIGGLLAYIYMKRYWTYVHDIKLFKEYASYGWPLMLGNIAALMMNLADKFSLNFLSSKSELGLYAFALSFSLPFAAFVFGPFMKAWVPLRWELFRKPNCNEAFRKVAGSLATFFPALALLYIGIAVVGARLLAQDASYHSALHLIPILAMSSVLYGLYWYELMGFLFAKRTKFFPILTTTMGILNIILNIVLVSRFGALGAAVATVTSFLVIRYAAYFLSQRIYRYSRRIFSETLLLTLTIFFAITLSFISSIGNMYFILVSAIFSCIIIALGFVTRLVEPQYVVEIFALLKKKIGLS